MSFAGGDMNNDGSPEFYATDMHPYQRDPATMRVWQPILDNLLRQLPAADRQKITNVLQVWQGNQFQNIAARLGVQHTGWSWSAQFGDLDSDGFLDLYVVNGMIAADIFGHLPNAELVEENQVFRNLAGEKFAPAPEWGLNATQSGRGMTMADMDNDGDLDIVVNNVLSSAMLYENQLCSGSNLTIDIQQMNSQNPQGIGTRLILTTSTGIYQREIVAASGYLSGSTSRVHFGFPKEAQLEKLEIIQVDGTMTRLDNLEANRHFIFQIISDE
jgi:hypothetical protein